MWSIALEISPFFIAFLLYVLIAIKPWYNKILGIYFVLGFFYSIFDQTAASLYVKMIIWAIPPTLVLLHILIFKKFYLKGELKFLLFAVVFFISSIINHTKLQLAAFYFMDYLMPFCLLFLGLNISTDDDRLKKIMKLILFLFLFQVIASAIKYVKYGAIEPLVGSIQSLSGSANTILVLIMISFFISFYLIYKDKRYIYGLLLPVLIGISTEKRAIWFYIPLLIITIKFILNYYDKNLMRSLKQLIPISILLLAIVYVGIRLSPTLNPDNKIWGEFNLEYVIEYTDEYNYQISEEGVPTQRFSGIIGTYEEMGKWNVQSILFGQGPGFVDDWVKNEKGFKWGFWGRETSLSMFLISFGALGIIALYWYLFGFFKYVRKSYYIGNKFDKAIALMVSGFYVIYIFDLFYSRSAIENHIMSPVMMFFTGYCLRVYFNRNQTAIT